MDAVTAVILAGGLGSRLRAVVADRPKVLAEVRGRPFLGHLLDQLAAAGFREVVLCTGYLGDQVRALFGDAYRGIRVVYSQEPMAMGTAGALRMALPLLNSDPVLVMNGDSFYDMDLRAFLTWHCSREADATLALVRVNDSGRFGQVRIDADGAIVAFEEKSGDSHAGWINAGVYLLARPLIKSIPENRAVSLEKEMFPTWIGRGFYGYSSQGRFLDIGTPEAYLTAAQFFATEGGV